MPNHLTPKGEASRQTIIQAAYAQFLEHGYHAATIRDIACQAGLTIGGVYTYFAGKEEIFIAVLDTYHPFRPVLEGMLAAEGDSLESLAHDAARRMVAGLGAQREALNLVFIEVVEFQGQHFGDLFPQVFPRLMILIQRLAEQPGDLRPLPLPVIGRSFFGLVFSYFMTNIILSQSLPQDDTVLDTFVDIYLHGILQSRS
jgi:AcrR family transcriptional regulator